jgi:hypothetical protein
VSIVLGGTQLVIGHALVALISVANKNTCMLQGTDVLNIIERAIGTFDVGTNRCLGFLSPGLKH